MIKERIRKWLGIDEVIERAWDIRAKTSDIEFKVTQLRTEVRVSSLAMGRIINKIDPMYRVPEDDPERKRQSDLMADEVIRKLKAEHAASNPTEPR